MPKGYLVAHIDVSDVEGFKAYIAASTAAVAAQGGRHIVRGGRASQVEGELRRRHAIAEFPSFEQALACYESAGYQRARALRLAAAQADVVLVEGVD